MSSSSSTGAAGSGVSKSVSSLKLITEVPLELRPRPDLHRLVADLVHAAKGELELIGDGAKDDDKASAKKKKKQKSKLAKVNKHHRRYRQMVRQAVQDAVDALRTAVLTFGIQCEQKKDTLSVRGKVWKALLGIDHVDAEVYMALVGKGECKPREMYVKIRGDAFRTFPVQQDPTFRTVVDERAIVRLLNSFTHAHGGPDSYFSYVQGMNAICAPFLYCMPEVDAYFAFCKLIIERFPLYWGNDHSGSQAGCVLLDRVLAIVDEELYKHLSRTIPQGAYLYAFSVVSSLSASARPFVELVELWDFLMSFGPHLNILCVAAQIIMIRDRLLSSNNPKQILDYRTWPPLKARFIISVTMSILQRVPADLYELIARHGWDPEVTSKLIGRPVKFWLLDHQKQYAASQSAPSSSAVNASTSSAASSSSSTSH